MCYIMSYLFENSLEISNLIHNMNNVRHFLCFFYNLHNCVNHFLPILLIFIDFYGLTESSSDLDPTLDRVFSSFPSLKAPLNQNLYLNDPPCTTKFLTRSLLKSCWLSTKWLATVSWIVKHSSVCQILKSYTYLIWI